MKLPTIDLSPLRSGDDPTLLAADIRRCCRELGFFYVIGHGVSPELRRRLEEASRRFFALDLERKMEIRMERGGRAWRGYFPVGTELTSGRPDQKEGLYFGAELADDHPAVRAGRPLHGRNLFPEELPELCESVLAWLDAMTTLGHLLMEGIALSLGLDRRHFAERYTGDPLVLFRIFHYPPLPAEIDSEVDDDVPLWSVGKHTDYGLLTLLAQDEVGGLQVETPNGWIEAPPLPDAFVCNLGDMLDRMTGGFYRSTPHRVLNRSSRSRLSFPFFFDPGFDAVIEPVVAPSDVDADAARRWDRSSPHSFEGSYGDYLLDKVGRVFPELSDDVL